MVLTLAACGNKTENKEAEKTENTEMTETTAGDFTGKTLTLAGLDGGYGTEGWKAVIAGFEKKTGAKVEARFEKNIYDVIRPEIQAGNAPDVIYNSLGQETALTETMIKENMIMDISDVFNGKVLGEENIVKDKILDGALETSVTNPYGDGKQYLAPLFYSPNGLWYNQAMFKDGGGKYDLPKTFDDMVKLGETAKADGVALWTYPTAGYFDSFMFALINEVGGPELFNKLTNYDAEAWKNEATPLFENVAKLLPYLHKNTVAQANNESFTKNQLSVMTNESLFMPNGTWIVNEMKDAQGVAEGFKWGFMPLPALTEGGDRYAFSYLEEVFVSKDAKEPELAKAFISYLYSDEAVKAFADNGAFQPVKGVDQYITDENNKLFYSVYKDGAKAAMGTFAAAPAVEGVSIADALFQAVDSVANGDKTVQDWQAGVVDAAQKLADAIKAQ